MAESDMIVIYDYKFREAVKLTGIRMDITKCPEEREELLREKDKGNKSAIESARAKLVHAKREFFGLALARGKDHWTRLNWKGMQSIIRKIEKSASRLKALIGKENAGD